MPETRNNLRLGTRSTLRPRAERGSAYPGPFPALDGLRGMTDDTGIFQHGIGGIPDPVHGYTTDDNARAFLAAVRLWRRWPAHRHEIEPLLKRYISFLRWTQVQDGPSAGRFVNFVGYDRKFLDTDGTTDCLGRCLWALAEAASGLLPSTVEVAVETVLARARERLEELVVSPRASAYALLGLCRDPQFNPAHIRTLAAPLIKGWDLYAKGDWRWFEPYLTYDNARLVEACRRAGDALDDPHLCRIADESLEFLTEHSFRDGILYPIGNRGWWNKSEPIADFDQQTLEAAAYVELYRLVGDSTREHQARAWFLGENVHRAALVDPETGVCHDGLHPDGVNRNSGAESVVSWLLALA